MATTRAEVLRRRLTALGSQGLGAEEYLTSMVDVLRQAVPFDAACAATVDPATGLLTGTVKADLGDARDRDFAHFEFEVEDVNHYREIAARRDPVGVLDHDTAGRPETSPRWRDFLVPHFGLTHELRAAFRADGQAWGMLGLYRSGSGGGFGPAEAEFVAGLSETVARGLRAAVVTSTADAIPASPAGPAVVVVGAAGTVVSATAAATTYLVALGAPNDELLPAPLHTVVAAARAFRDGRIGSPPRVRARAASGEWFVMHAAPLAGTAGGEVVVTFEPARPPDIVPLVVAAYGLTERERDVAHLVLAGLDTAAIGARLHLSPYTVQDHLKSIFDKAGVRSRRELTAQVFFEQYAPRLGDPLGPSGWFAGGG